MVRYWLLGAWGEPEREEEVPSLAALTLGGWRRRQMQEAAAISLQGATVLELGAGMGLCGLLAAQLGARHVVITDCSYVGLKVLLSNCDDARRVTQVTHPLPRWGVLAVHEAPLATRLIQACRAPFPHRHSCIQVIETRESALWVLSRGLFTAL